MTNHPNRSKVRYFKLSPRGFANEVTYFIVRPDQTEEVDAYFAGFEDKANGGYCGWTSDRAARLPGVAVRWADRAYVI